MTDRRWTDEDRELVAGLVRALPPPPRLPGEVGSLGPSPEQFAERVLDALTAAGWRPPPATVFDEIDATIAALKARNERGNDG